MRLADEREISETSGTGQMRMEWCFIYLYIDRMYPMNLFRAQQYII